ncbi:MAG: hypothetical protein WAW59_04250 [Patescibacteria group bacterium]
MTISQALIRLPYLSRGMRVKSYDDTPSATIVPHRATRSNLVAERVLPSGQLAGVSVQKS